jgi:hypothetical protein
MSSHNHNQTQNPVSHQTNDPSLHNTDSTTGFASSDPTTHPEAKSTSKLAGDMKGAVHGATGSLQAATGTLLRNKNMQEKGFEKMGEEDQRLAAKKGKTPVGTDTRDGIVGAETGRQQAATTQGGVQHTQH